MPPYCLSLTTHRHANATPLPRQCHTPATSLPHTCWTWQGQISSNFAMAENQIWAWQSPATDCHACKIQAWQGAWQGGLPRPNLIFCHGKISLPPPYNHSTATTLPQPCHDPAIIFPYYVHPMGYIQIWGMSPFKFCAEKHGRATT